jgi:L-alanine-DL-glutamate epimerase-like enolase superfamily enzyme
VTDGAAREAPLPPIERIEAFRVRVPRIDARRVTHAYGTTPDAEYALVRVHAGGLVGLGEAPPEIWWTGEDSASVVAVCEGRLAPALAGRSIGIRDAAARMDRALAGNPYAKAAVEMALWDLLGKVAGLPLWALLGGAGPEAVETKYGMGWCRPDEVADHVEAGRAVGIRVFKLKVGRALEDDLAAAGALAGELRDGERFGVDANGGWTLPTAIAALAPLADLGAAFLEQPVAARFPHHLRELTRRSRVPVLAHESVFSAADGLAAATSGLAHLWALTPPTHGGILATLDLLGIARAAGIPCLLGSTFELGVATAMLVHLAAATPELRAAPVPSDIAGPLYLDRDVVTRPHRIADGRLVPPAGAGLGVELDEDAVRRYSEA